MAKALGGTPRFWVQLQANHAIAQSKEALDKLEIKRLAQAA